MIELLLILSPALFPPIFLTIVVVVVLASVGRSLGIRETYVRWLVHFFEWAATEMHKSSENEEKQAAGSRFVIGGSSIDTEEDPEDPEQNDMSVNGSLPNGGLTKRYGSTTSIASVGSVTMMRTRRPSESSTLGIIRRETQITLGDDDDEEYPEEVQVHSRGWAMIDDSVLFVRNAVEAIIEDDVTSRFEAEQLLTWNMLTRTSTRFYRYTNWKLSMIYYLGIVFRYGILLPLRMIFFAVGMFILVFMMSLPAMAPTKQLKKRLNYHTSLISFRILSRSITSLVYFHNEENRAKGGGICVANHTSPIDAMILSVDNAYALIGQKHGGLLGGIQRALSRGSNHIWFERSEARDREKVAQRLRDHCSDPENLPVLIFPEGTCINNTSVMMFKKGCFEVGATIYPIAMKYDSRFGDAFWNSSEQSWFGYIVRMMTSWAIICNVYYLPPMTRNENEDAVEFANRVKKTIAKRGGLVDLEWDGGLKRSRVPVKMVQAQQSKYANRVNRYHSSTDDKVPELKLEEYANMDQVLEEPISDSENSQEESANKTMVDDKLLVSSSENVEQEELIVDPFHSSNDNGLRTTENESVSPSSLPVENQTVLNIKKRRDTADLDDFSSSEWSSTEDNDELSTARKANSPTDWVSDEDAIKSPKPVSLSPVDSGWEENEAEKESHNSEK